MPCCTAPCLLHLRCSGNGLLLKGGKEASRSNAILHKTIVDAIGPNLGPDLIHLITSRDEISDLLKLDDVIDLVIPRGGNALVTHIQQNTKIPVLGHADGICHVYVDKAADLDKAVKIIVDAKVDYPAACNAVEKVLVHENLVGNGGMSKIQSALQDAGVQVSSLVFAACAGARGGGGGGLGFSHLWWPFTSVRHCTHFRSQVYT